MSSGRDDQSSPISPVLFMSVSGEPMRFYLRPSPTKVELLPIINAGGGLLCRAQESNAILLADPKDMSPAMASTAHFYISTKYIRDCVEKNEQLELEDYRFTEHVQTWFSRQKRERSGSVGRLAYLPEEDSAILDFVSKCKGETRGNRMWQEMEKQGLINRSWQSIQARYQKHLCFKAVKEKVERHTITQKKHPQPSPLHKQSTSPGPDPDLESEPVSEPVSEPDLSEPDLSEPDRSEPEPVSEPDLSEPDRSEPEPVSEPDLSEPDLSEPDRSEPEPVSEPDLSEAGLSEPELHLDPEAVKDEPDQSSEADVLESELDQFSEEEALEPKTAPEPEVRQVQVEEAKRSIRWLMEETNQNLEAVTKALIMFSGDVSAALIYLNNGTWEGPLWEYCDDKVLKSADLSELRLKYGDKAVARRLAYLDMD